MAISMSSVKVETGERDSLLSSSIDSTIAAGETLNKGGFSGTGAATGATLAGVTSSFASNVSKEIDSYCEEVDRAIEQLSKVETNQAFKGAGLEQALNNFIESVKSVAKSYTTKLKSAETEIISNVAKAYETQDTDLSGNLGSDASSLESNIVS